MMPYLHFSLPLQVVLSDGTRHFSGMTATQLNFMIENGTIIQHCLLKIKQFVINTMGSGVKVIIITDCEVVGKEENRIGTPMDVSKVGVVNGVGGGMNNQGGGGGMYSNVQSNQ